MVDERNMAVGDESEVLMALRHVQSGRRCIERQFGVIAALRSKDLATEQAEAVLEWLEETQRTFEDHYKKVLSDGLAAIDVADSAFSPPPSLHPEANVGSGHAQAPADSSAIFSSDRK
jgi:hypothetical protein